MTQDNGWYERDEINSKPGVGGEVEVEFDDGRREVGRVEMFNWDSPLITRYRYLIYSEETHVIYNEDASVPEETPLGIIVNELTDASMFDNMPSIEDPFATVPLDALYNKLSDVLRRAYAQAASGKGKDRHAQAGEAFDAQVMADMAKRFGVGTLLGQAFKKSEESQRLPHDRAINEILGAINYLAGAIIHMEKYPK